MLALTASVRAQPESAAPAPTVSLCDAPWMDAERVRALLAVELGPAASALQVHVHSCTLVSADLRVRFGVDEAPERTNHLDLSQTAVGARSRLVALVVAELVRLGPPAPPAESPGATLSPAQAAQAAPVEPLEQAADAVSAEPAPEEPALEEPAPDEAAPEETAPDESAPEEPAPEEPVDDEAATEESAQAAHEGEALSRCEGWSRFGRGPCSWAISVAYGGALHQLGLLGRRRQGSAVHHQLRVLGRWRYLFAGVRVYGSLSNPGPDVLVGGATAFAGVEYWARRWSKNVLALRAGLEAGVQGFRSPDLSDPVTGLPAVDVCGVDCTSFGEPVFGGSASVRYERAVGIFRAAVELELGWSTGFRVDIDGQLLSGLGGPSLALNIDLSIGKAE